LRFFRLRTAMEAAGAQQTVDREGTRRFLARAGQCGKLRARGDQDALRCDRRERDLRRSRAVRSLAARLRDLVPAHLGPEQDAGTDRSVAAQSPPLSAVCVPMIGAGVLMEGD